MLFSYCPSAISRDLINVVHYIIETYGVSVDGTIKAPQGKTFTMLDGAILGKSKKVIKYFMNKGAQLTTQGQTTLHWAVCYLDDGEDIIDAILEREPNLLNVQDKNGYTPFMMAIIENKRKAMEHLLTKDGLNLAIKDRKYNGNALAWAVFYNRPVDFIKRILDKEAKLLDEYSGEGQNKKSLLHEALSMKFDNNESVDARQNREALIKELIKRKPDLLKEKDGKGRSPLEYAKFLKSKGSKIIDETVMAILEKGEESLSPESLTTPQPTERAVTKLPSSPGDTSTLGGTLPDVSDKSKNSVKPLSTGSNNTSEPNPGYYVGLIGIPVVLGIMCYGIKKMFETKDKLTVGHGENKNRKDGSL